MGAKGPNVQGLLQELVERQRLLERLSKIQASMSHRQPLQDVLDAITQGAADLIGDEVVGLRLPDPNDSGYVVVVSSYGLDEQTLRAIRRTPASEGAGGRAMLENRLVVIERYEESARGLGVFRERHLQAAMAAPVREQGRAIGSLVVASYRGGRTYSESEKEALMSLAEHASLALTDAKTVEAMREAQRDKDMFLAMVSHELKTPLTVIMGTLEVIKRKTADLEDRAIRDLLRSATERSREMARMIDLLLEGASAELIGEVKAVSLAEVLADAARGFDHTLRMQIREVPDVECRVDIGSVRRILGILLENALAHSPSGGPIRMGASIADAHMAFWVENEGSLPENVESVFEPFQRGAGARSSGVGLGLYIASRLAASIKGRLQAASTEGVVRFTLRMPRESSGSAGGGVSGAPDDDTVLAEDT